MFWKTLKIVIPILFIPVVIASTKAFLGSLDDLSLSSNSLALLTGGFFAYPIFHIVFLKPMYIYAWGHEIVHVLATWICGGKVTSFSISHAGGSVTTTKSNLFITISPYFVPIHTIFLCFIYWILSRFCDMSQFSKVFVFLIGFTMSFHIFMTIEIMKMRQPDIVKTGQFFSLIFIYVTNLFVVQLVLSAIFRNVSIVSFAKKTWYFSKDIYLNIFDKLVG